MLPRLAESGSTPTILVVDDASPDGTGRIADRLAAELPEVRVLHRVRKDGLGRAYLAGFAAALEGGADLILQMDCDFSHDPADVPRLIAASRARRRRRSARATCPAAAWRTGRCGGASRAAAAARTPG